uniref:Uncharacterized protein n=1 Tax=Nicotiana tabacum TaxID=4097 RepID=A0A1S4AGZ2_TOBAC|nr:PREDICTED: uncharacterized protein LOC107797586 [Nicotiana tabacum]
MTLSLLSPSPSALCFVGSTSNSSSADFTGHFRKLWTSRSRTGSALPVLTRASSEKDDDKPAFNPFGFVTDNPSSRSAIQMPESPAEDGNVGQMLYRIEDKGKEYGSYVKSGKFRWFVRETGSPESRRGTVIFLHGAPTQSYSYRVVMSQVLILILDFTTFGVRNFC